jgi:tetratricopeptide (TPR) repeat protein
MPRPPNIPQRKLHSSGKVKLAQQPDVDALFMQGLALHQQGQLTQASAIYEQVLSKSPRHFDALHLSGVIANQTKNNNLAVELIGKAIEINPNYAAAYSNHGNALLELKRFEEAVVSYGRAIEINPDYAEAFYNRGNALKELRRPDEAVASYDKAIQIRPDFAEAYCNRGLALKELKRVEEAMSSYDRAIEIKPDYAMAYSNRGNALQELKRLEESVASHDRAISLRPDYAEAYSNRGVALQELRRLEEALANYDKAIAIKPDYAEAYWNKSLISLLIGDLESGWNMYEWRWKRESFNFPKYNFSQPLWLGKEDIADKTILLHAEQGLGDAIQFCRYAILVKAKGARVVMEVPQALMGLLENLDGVNELLVQGKPRPSFDYHCPLLSLPLALKTDLASIPSPTAYLAAQANKCQEWSQKLGHQTKPRVGLVWSGSTTHQNDRNRSLTLLEILPHLPQACEYVSLQKELREVDKEVMAGSGIRHFGEEIKDFTDTAALCELMDVVVSVDTSVAHLSAAIGKATWILLPYVPDWRWLLDRDNSPWYGSAKLYRQDESRTWGAVLKRVTVDLLKSHPQI